MNKLSRVMVYSGYAIVPGLYVGLWALLIWVITAMGHLKDQQGPPVTTHSSADGARIEFLGDDRELQR